MFIAYVPELKLIDSADSQINIYIRELMGPAYASDDYSIFFYAVKSYTIDSEWVTAVADSDAILSDISGLRFLLDQTHANAINVGGWFEFQPTGPIQANSVI